MKKSDIELEGFGTYLLEQGKREITVEDYKRHIQNFHSWLVHENSSLQDLTRYDIQQYIYFGSVAKFEKSIQKIIQRR
ncbi:hypothetical protein BM86_18380 [Bacillus thuringiensis]|uniref:Core-binding (CB) domain-containing protein n=1 Tax=Bacillus thuringiensis TaxID=1428 RepID=A0A9W3SI74_BACTU|nr:site-specific integrase [Bacillus thuringiensis]ANS51799.1 hypothetical protein BT246_65070 [Bacillus thuringiensis]MBH0337388.1 hypothetical protein [Bacillus thuringiensis]